MGNLEIYLYLDKFDFFGVVGWLWDGPSKFRFLAGLGRPCGTLKAGVPLFWGPLESTDPIAEAPMAAAFITAARLISDAPSFALLFIIELCLCN